MRPAAILVLLLVLGIRSAFAFEVAMIGDKSKRAALQRIGKEMSLSVSRSSGLLRLTSADKALTFTATESSDDPFRVADQLLTADVAFLVVDATKGPLPKVREELVIARQARIPSVVIYFANTRGLQRQWSQQDAPELLELEELEMRELVNLYFDKGGDKAQILFEDDVSAFYRSPYARGAGDRKRFLASYSLRRPPRPALQQVSEFKCDFYLFTKAESANKSVALADGQKIEVWLEGKAATGTVKSPASHEPGAVGEFVLRFPAPLEANAGSRALLVHKGSTVGVATVSRVLR